MRATAKALKDFVSSFNLPAYTTESVPQNVTVPYLTYPLAEPEWDQKTSFYIQGWYRTTSNTALVTKADEIISAIGTGIKIDTGVGYISIYPETPLVQMLTNSDYRSFYINLSINAYQMPGAFPAQQNSGQNAGNSGQDTGSNENADDGEENAENDNTNAG